MIPSAIKYFRPDRCLLGGLAGAGLLLAVPAIAQDNVRDRDPDAADVALTPLTDLNLTGDLIPPALWQARIDPYASEGIADCGDILSRLGDLDAVLGDDVDATPVSQRDLTAGGVAQGVVGMLIPFRGIIREVSGANDREHEFQQAIVAGMMRRAYLKGLGEARGCEYPARPMPAAMATRLGLDKPLDEDAAAPVTSDGGFVSRPVVQPID